MFFTNTVNDVSEQDLLQLIDHQSEDETWEFKSQWPKDNLSIQKGVCAFANTGGGYYIIGVECDEAGLVTGVPGVTSLAQHNERVVSSCGAIAPRVIPQVREVPLSNGNVVPVVYAAPSQYVPHMASDGKYYLRAGRQSTPMPESMVERLYEARRTREQRIEAFLEEVQYGVRPFDPGEWLWVSAFAVPLQLNEALMQPTRELLQSLRDLCVHTGILQPGANAENSYYGFTADLGTPIRTNFFLELRRNGFLTAGRTYRRAAGEAGVTQVPWMSVAQVLTEFLGVASRVYEMLGHLSFVRLGLVLSNVSESMLSSFFDTRAPHQPGPEPLTWIYRHDILASDIEESLVPLAESLMARLAQSYGLAVYDVPSDWPDCHQHVEACTSTIRSTLS
jgi:hypothetical protein